MYIFMNQPEEQRQAQVPRCRMPQRRKAPGAGDPPGCRQVQDTSPETADPPAPGKHPLTNVFKNRANLHDMPLQVTAIDVI